MTGWIAPPMSFPPSFCYGICSAVVHCGNRAGISQSRLDVGQHLRGVCVGSALLGSWVARTVKKVR